MADNWDDWDSSAPAGKNITTTSNGFGNSTENGFYVGRGRGFGSIGSMANSLPKIGGEPKSASSNPYQNDDWDEEPSSNNNTWQPSSNSYNNSNSYGGGSNRTYGVSQTSKGKSGFLNNVPAKGKFSKGCHKCNEEGHIARDCPKSGGGGGGRDCYNCGQSGHMSRDCPNEKKSGGGGGRSCYNCGESGHMSRECPNEKKSGGGGGDRGCFNCGESGHMSRECPNERKSGGGDRACFNCGESGHMSRECPNEKKSGGGGGGDRACFNCGESGHMSRECPTERKSGGGGGGDRACFNCGESGHMSRECPNEKKSGGGGGDRGCFNCGESGHMSRECPNERKSGGGGGDRACFKCKEEGHMAKDCPNDIGEDGKPRPPPYIPPEPTDDAESLFVGVPTGINFAKYDQIHVDVSGASPPPPIESFESSGLCNHLLQNIAQSKYTRPTPVQKYAIPIIMQNRDLMACAQTGSGKTAAFLLPILNKMIPNQDLPNNANNETQEPWAVVVAPTRELVIQIGSEARKFAYDSVVKADILYGGTSTSYQSNRIKRGCHLLVATPGRLLDFLEKGKISFSQLRYFVLDEADRMLDMGFAPAIRKMVEHESMPEKGVRRTLMFSATFPEDIQRMASEFLDNYLFLTVGMVGAANADVEQTFFNVGQFDKREKLLEILRDVGSDRTLVFVEQKRTADFIASLCSQNNIPTTSIHGDRMQREREEALRDFRTGKMPVLVATAVAARGLDIRDVRHVINYDLPQTIDEYVHRIGRTGRVGNLGKATSFYDSSNDQPLSRSLKKILIDAQQNVPDWLSEEANQAGGAPVYGGRGNFGSRDVRNQGRGRKIDSNDAFDNVSSEPVSSSFQGPVADDEEWG